MGHQLLRLSLQVYYLHICFRKSKTMTVDSSVKQTCIIPETYQTPKNAKMAQDTLINVVGVKPVI